MENEAGTLPVKQAPAGQYYATVGGREMLIKYMNPAQSMVLAGFFRQTKGPLDWETLISIYGKVMRLLDALIVEKADLDWLEEHVMDGSLMLEDFASVFSAHETVQEQPVAKKPRRGK